MQYHTIIRDIYIYNGWKKVVEGLKTTQRGKNQPKIKGRIRLNDMCNFFGYRCY